MNSSSDRFSTTVGPSSAGSEPLAGSASDSEDDSLLREIAGAPFRTPPVIHMLAPGALVAGKYRVEEKIGAGGMGSVFRAVDLRLGRMVAIKMQHGRSASIEQLRHEARLLARLSHPNVVTVLEVGTHEGAAFVAMEYVPGGGARRWARQPGRTWQEILAVYVEAARGLAAAHAIGIVHRDFKPDNLLVGDDGRARVADFGLADASTASTEDVEVVRLLERVGVTTDSHPVRATAAGALVGTPAYVAPEQIRSSRVDARADQFSFCAALFEALYGELPFPGATAAEVLTAILEGDVVEPSHRRGVPRWLNAAIRRGLARDPKDRFGNMDALREALAGPRSRWPMAVAGLGALAITAAWLGARPDQRDPRCVDDPSRVWDSRRAGIGASVAAAPERTLDAWRRLDRRLDERGRSWSAAWVTACAAERDDATGLSLAVMRTRLGCLDDQRRLTEALFDTLHDGDPAVVARVLDSASAWDDPLACIAEASALTSASTTSDSGDSAGVREMLGRVQAWAAAGDTVAAAALAEVALNYAQSSGDDRMIAKALLARGHARFLSGRYQAGLEDTTAAFTLAERVGDDDVMSHAALDLAVANRLSDGAAVMEWITQARRHLHRWPDDAPAQIRMLALEAEVRADRGDFESAAALFDQAEGLAQRAGVGDEISAELWLTHAGVAVERGDFGNAANHAEHARELLENALGPDHYHVGTAWARLGFVYDSAGNLTEARQRYRRALELFEGPGGGLDYRQAQVLVSLATLDTLLGNSAEALAELDRARAINTALGHDDPELAVAATEARGLALLDLDRAEEAMAEFTLVTELLEQRWGSAHPGLRNGLLNVALSARALGRFGEARTALERAVRIQTDLPNNDLIASDVYHSYGFALLDAGEYDEAAKQFEQAAKQLQLGFGDDHTDHGWPALGLGRVELARGRPAEALARFERAATAWASEDADGHARADLAFSTAEALWQLGRRDEAIAKARAALTARPTHIALREWLDAHAPGAAHER